MDLDDLVGKVLTHIVKDVGSSPIWFEFFSVTLYRCWEKICIFYLYCVLLRICLYTLHVIHTYTSALCVGSCYTFTYNHTSCFLLSTLVTYIHCLKCNIHNLLITEQCMHLVNMGYAYVMVYDKYPKGITCHVLDCIQFKTGHNMALHIDDQLILCDHTDAYRSNMMGCSYCGMPNYLIVQGWIRAMLLYPTNIYLAGLNVHHYTKSFLGWLGMMLLVSL